MDCAAASECIAASEAMGQRTSSSARSTASRSGDGRSNRTGQLLELELWKVDVGRCDTFQPRLIRWLRRNLPGWFSPRDRDAAAERRPPEAERRPRDAGTGRVTPEPDA
jgi:hypothetical protein